MLYVVSYSGKTLMSRLIRWFSWDDKSHVAVIDLSKNRLWESSAKHGGVRIVEGADFDCVVSNSHKPGTPWQLWSIVEDINEGAMIDWMDSHLGSKYDFMCILGFIIRRPIQHILKFVCSEYVVEAMRAGGSRILGARPAWKVKPSDMTTSGSLLLVLEGETVACSV